MQRRTDSFETGRRRRRAARRCDRGERRDVHDVLAALAEHPVARREVHEELATHIELDADDVVVEGDPTLLERAISNLIRNAIDPGVPSSDAPIEVVVRQGLVAVAGHGPCVSDDVADRIFERFHSRPGSTGHGLGLPLARWVARAHGGDLTVANRSIGGAVFTMELPAAKR
ncbi:MAG: sensor histidine kinase [Ilumatobacter sp.]